MFSFFFFISGSTVNGSNCPPGAMNIVKDCIKNFVPSFLPTERSVEAEIELWRRTCLYVEKMQIYNLTASKSQAYIACKLIELCY